MLGLGLSIPQVAARGSRSLVAAIRSLFAANEPGVWYDPSDLSTLFQDAAGTTPVTAVEQPVGLMLDKSKGLVLGPELVTNGDFSNGTTGWTATTVGVSFSDGVLTFNRTAGNPDPLATNTGSATSGKTYVLSFDVLSISAGTVNLGIKTGAGSVVYYGSGLASVGKKQLVFTATATGQIQFYSGGVAPLTTVIDNISVRELPGNHASQPTATSRPVLSARLNQYLATETLATQNVTTLAAQYRLSFEGTGTITLSGTATGVYLAGSHLITCTAGTLTSTVSGSVTKADLRVANDGANLPPYQRVNTATDYDTVGFPHYLRFDGVDDWLVTNTITPGIDKVQVFAGVNTQADAVTRAICELSADMNNNNGTAALFWDSGRWWRVSSKGTLRSNADFPEAGPLTRVLTGLAGIAVDSATLRVNGTQAASSTTDQGIGNYLAYPLYIGRRGGTAMPFNGRLYSLIVRFGSNLPAATIEKTEKYINTKTRAY